MKRVAVHIDRLVLGGVHNADAHAIGEGMQAELARALADPTTGRRLASLGRVPSLNVGKLRLDGRLHGLGIAAGRAIAKGISQ